MKHPRPDKSEATSKEPVQNSHFQLQRSHEETPQDYDCEPADFIDPEDFRSSRSEADPSGKLRAELIDFSNESGGLEPAARCVRHCKLSYLMTMVEAAGVELCRPVENRELIEFLGAHKTQNARKWANR